MLINRCSYFLVITLLIGCNSTASNKSANSNNVEILPYYNDESFTPHWLKKGDPTLDTFHKISSFSLMDQDGKIITEKTFKGKVYVTDFFFTTCPGICPKMMDNMELLQSAFKDNNDFLILSHTVTPTRDSVPILKEYAINRGVLSSKWHLVTGDQQEIYRLGRREYFIEEDLGVEKELDEFLHTENFVLIDKESHIRGIYNGLNKSSVNQLKVDIQTLLASNK